MGHTVRIDSWAVALAAPEVQKMVRHDRTIGSPIQNLVAESDIAETPDHDWPTGVRWLGPVLTLLARDRVFCWQIYAG